MLYELVHIHAVVRGCMLGLLVQRGRALQPSPRLAPDVETECLAERIIDSTLLTAWRICIYDVKVLQASFDSLSVVPTCEVCAALLSRIAARSVGPDLA
jgi:hypothetical protein